MKQLILNLSQRFGMYTLNLSMSLLGNGHMLLFKFVFCFNNKQMTFHNYLMSKFQTNKSLNLSHKVRHLFSLVFILLIIGCTSSQKIYTPQVNKAPHSWTVSQWQNVIDCSFKEGKGSDWDCDSCYITYAKKYHITIDTAILNYY